VKENYNLKKFWAKKQYILDWFKPSKIVLKKNNQNYTWFNDGKINLFYNCVEKNILEKKSNKIAIITVNQKCEINKFSYLELDKKIDTFCSFVSSFFFKENISYKKIMIHASASIESAVAMLACSKLGIHFSVIFEDLEELSVRNRISIFKPDLIISRFPRKIFFKKYSKKTLGPNLKYSFFEDINNKVPIKKFKIKHCLGNRDLFTLFTSGSTGQPKGITHSTAGYLLYAKYSCAEQFGMNPDSVVLTASDAAWINGHTYALFGPLSFGATTVLLEKPMLLLNKELLKKILRFRISILYLPVTLIRLMKSLFDNSKFSSKYLKAIGSMGEPLAQTIGTWYAKAFCMKDSAIVNTYFQTETGGIICSPKYHETKKDSPHGSVGKPINNYLKLNKLFDKQKEILIEAPWPGCMKKILNGKKEWNKYWNKEGSFRLFDFAVKKNDNIYIQGRVDDVINIRGHRIGSAEIEAVVLQNSKVKECSAVSIEDELEGFVFILFVVSNNYEIEKNIKETIVSSFGTFALPKRIIFLQNLPKTRSGKILRRLLRQIYKYPYQKNYGDTSTMLDPSVVNEIKHKIQLS